MEEPRQLSGVARVRESERKKMRKKGSALPRYRLFDFDLYLSFSTIPAKLLCVLLLPSFSWPSSDAADGECASWGKAANAGVGGEGEPLILSGGWKFLVLTMHTVHSRLSGLNVCFVCLQ